MEGRQGDFEKKNPKKLSQINWICCVIWLDSSFPLIPHKSTCLGMASGGVSSADPKQSERSGVAPRWGWGWERVQVFVCKCTFLSFSCLCFPTRCVCVCLCHGRVFLPFFLNTYSGKRRRRNGKWIMQKWIMSSDANNGQRSATLGSLELQQERVVTSGREWVGGG